MRVYKFEPSGFASNSFAVTADGKNCILIDCAEPAVLDECKRLNLTVCAVLLTHGHFDHVGGCAEAEKRGAKIYCGKGEDKLIFSSAYLGMFGGVDVPKFTVGAALGEGNVNICGLDIQVIATPGHTSGGVAYLVEDALFTGDTLFEGSVGRTDLPTGDWNVLIQSIKKLYSLDGDYKVYCGHGGDTTLERERKYNQFVRA